MLILYEHISLSNRHLVFNYLSFLRRRKSSHKETSLRFLRAAPLLGSGISTTKKSALVYWMQNPKYSVLEAQSTHGIAAPKVSELSYISDL